MMRISSALEYDVAEIILSKDDAHKVARAEARIGSHDEISSSHTAAIVSTTNNKPRNTSSEDGGHPIVITTTSGEDRTQSNNASMSPRPRDTNILHPKSTMIKSQNSSSLSSSNGSGHVSFDCDTSFD